MLSIHLEEDLSGTKRLNLMTTDLSALVSAVNDTERAPTNMYRQAPTYMQHTPSKVQPLVKVLARGRRDLTIVPALREHRTHATGYACESGDGGHRMRDGRVVVVIIILVCDLCVRLLCMGVI